MFFLIILNILIRLLDGLKGYALFYFFNDQDVETVKASINHQNVSLLIYTLTNSTESDKGGMKTAIHLSFFFTIKERKKKEMYTKPFGLY